MIKNINAVAAPTNDNIEKANVTPNFKANENNSLERNPQNDTLEKRKHVGTKIAAGVVGLAGLAAVADLIFAHGKHLKGIFGKAEKIAQKGAKGVENTETLSREKFVEIINKNAKDLSGEEIDAILKKYFGDKNTDAIKELATELQKLKLIGSTKDTIKGLKAANKDEFGGILFDALLNEKIAKTKFGELKALDFCDEFGKSLEKTNRSDIKAIWSEIKSLASLPENKDLSLSQLREKYPKKICKELQADKSLLDLLLDVVRKRETFVTLR